MRINSIYVIESIKLIYPAIKDGFAYWETDQDGVEWENPIDGLIWENQEYQKPTWDQIESFLISAELKQKKQQKLQELDNYYNSAECWMFKVTYNNYSLTRSADWYAKMIPACAGRQITLFEDSSGFISINLTEEMAKSLNYQIQAIISLRILKTKKECKGLINNSISIEELENFDVKSFLGEVPRVVDLNSL